MEILGDNGHAITNCDGIRQFVTAILHISKQSIHQTTLGKRNRTKDRRLGIGICIGWLIVRVLEGIDIRFPEGRKIQKGSNPIMS